MEIQLHIPFNTAVELVLNGPKVFRTWFGIRDCVTELHKQPSFIGCHNSTRANISPSVCTPHSIIVADIELSLQMLS